MVIVFALIGGWIISTLYGAAFAAAADLLVPLSLAYLPWMAAQGLLIKLTSSASRSGAVVLILAAVAQGIAFASTIPDIAAMLWAFAGLGAAVLAVFVVLEWRTTRPVRSDLASR
jgi:hypothetical protein